MSAPCCAPRTPSAPRSASSWAPASMPAPAASPTPPTRAEHVPLWRFPDVEALGLPQHCVLVGVELLDDATDLPSFRHPVNAAYVLGPERSGLSPAMLRALPPRGADSDPLRAQSGGGRRAGAVRPAAAARPLRRAPGRQSRCGCHPAPVPTGHGPPRFRRNIPDWAAGETRSHDPSALVASDLAPYLCAMRIVPPDRALLLTLAACRAGRARTGAAEAAARKAAGRRQAPSGTRQVR